MINMPTPNLAGRPIKKIFICGTIRAMMPMLTSIKKRVIIEGAANLMPMVNKSLNIVTIFVFAAALIIDELATGESSKLLYKAEMIR